VTNVISTPVWAIEVTFVASRRLAPDPYPAAVDVRLKPARGRGICHLEPPAAVGYNLSPTD
jgi:hypothetical protein